MTTLVIGPLPISSWLDNKIWTLSLMPMSICLGKWWEYIYIYTRKGKCLFNVSYHFSFIILKKIHIFIKIICTFTQFEKNMLIYIYRNLQFINIQPPPLIFNSFHISLYTIISKNISKIRNKKQRGQVVRSTMKKRQIMINVHNTTRANRQQWPNLTNILKNLSMGKGHLSRSQTHLMVLPTRFFHVSIKSQKTVLPTSFSLSFIFGEKYVSLHVKNLLI